MVTPMAPNKRKTNPPRKGPARKRAGVLAVLALVGAALLSGCAGLGGSDEGNRAPRAEIDADKATGQTGDEFTFDAQSSMDPDGNLTSWEFDFGDGSPKETVTDEDAARVKHTYLEGGEYIVTVKVIDDGTHDGLGELSDEDSVHVAVDETSRVAAQVVRAEPVNTTAGSRMPVPFGVNDGADRATVNVTVQNALVVGASEVRLRLLDPSGKVLEEEVVSLPDTQPKDVEFDTMLESLGNHTLEVVAVSGSARVTGELEVVYSDVADLDKAKAEQ
ncbi:MAG: PKD domain-containing protein [Thermoplasmatota archaeon]